MPRKYRPDYAPDLFPHWTTLSIRYRDLDTLNHVNNALFSTYFEEARIRFIRQVPELLDQIRQGFSFVLAHLEIDFVKPAEYPAELLIGSGIKELGNSSITSLQAIFHEGNKSLIAVAESSGVWFDLNKQRPARIPEFPNPDTLMIDPERLA